MLEGDDADEQIAKARRRLTPRSELLREPHFGEVSPEAGELDADAVAALLTEAPDEALGLLAVMASAVDPVLRDIARSLAGRMMVDVARRGRVRTRRIGRMATVPWTGSGGDVDLDASMEALVSAHAERSAVTVADVRVREWLKPSTAWCLLVDRSGSMTGRPLATGAVAAAAMALRNPDDYSVLSFAGNVVAVKAQSSPRRVEEVVEGVLALRGHGTTNLGGALVAARGQLGRSTAARRITVLLSDCRATDGGDPVAAAAALDELVVLAPAGDDSDACKFASAVGGNVTTIAGPSDIPAALARLLP